MPNKISGVGCHFFAAIDFQAPQGTLKMDVVLDGW